MKAFTVYQPYAFAIVTGLKHYETRKKRTSIRGRVAVHAAKGTPRFVTMALDMALPEHMTLHYGAVIGTVAEAYGSEFKDGTHLHFEVSVNNVAKNPADYFEVVQEEK